MPSMNAASRSAFPAAVAPAPDENLPLDGWKGNATLVPPDAATRRATVD
jgi:hypothetical protein